jgi:hypothetical protein
MDIINYFERKPMNTARKSLYQIFTMLIAIAVIVGCDTDSTRNPLEPGSASQDQFLINNEPLALTMGDSCMTASGVLRPDRALQLKIGKSKANYQIGAVLSPTEVSFSICDLDPNGTTLAPKVQVFGPNSSLTFLNSVKVELELEHAGLPPNSPDNVRYMILRHDELSGNWYLHQKGKIKKKKIMYDIFQNGSYALALDSAVIQIVTRNEGGRLDLFRSNLNVAPGAFDQTRTIAFQMQHQTPEDLPYAWERVYEFLPDQSQFQAPVTLSVSFADAGRSGISGKLFNIKLYHFDESTSRWVLERDAQIDWVNKRVVVELTHFSRYAFAR